MWGWSLGEALLDPTLLGDVAPSGSRPSGHRSPPLLASNGSDGPPKCRWREADEAAFDEEGAFLCDEIYGGHSEAIVQRLTATERFNA